MLLSTPPTWFQLSTEPFRPDADAKVATAPLRTQRTLRYVYKKGVDRSTYEVYEHLDSTLLPLDRLTLVAATKAHSSS